MSSTGSQRGQSGADVGSGGPSTPVEELSRVPSQERAHEAPRGAGQPQLAGAGHVATPTSVPSQLAGQFQAEQLQAGPQKLPSVAEGAQ